MMKQPAETDFEIKVSDAGVEAIFKPTRSHYSYSRLADKKDIAQFGPLSPDPWVRHAGKSGDTDDYDTAMVQAMAYRLASEAARHRRS